MEDAVNEKSENEVSQLAFDARDCITLATFKFEHGIPLDDADKAMILGVLYLQMGRNSKREAEIAELE